MTKQNLEHQSSGRPSTPEITWRTFGYLAAILFLGVSMGLLLYPLLPYQAVAAWALLGIAILLLALTAPLLRKS